jgi:hypothetical protein
MATECNVQELVNSGNCFSCLTPKQLAYIQTQLLCDVLSALATPGSSVVTGGVVNPTTAPSGTYGIYYRTDTGAVWVWNGTAWIPGVA